MFASLNFQQLRITSVTSQEVRGQCPRLAGFPDIWVDLSNPIEKFVASMNGGLQVGDTVPCVPLSIDRGQRLWRGSLAFGKTMSFLAAREPSPAGSNARVCGIHEGRVLVEIDGLALGVLDSRTSSFLQKVPSAQLSTFTVGCLREDLNTGLVQVALPIKPVDEPLQLARVLCILEFLVSKRTRRRVRVVVRTASGVLGVASASELINWNLATGQHVTVDFQAAEQFDPLSDTNCVLIGPDFTVSRLPARAVTLDATIVKLQPYGAFCLVGNGATALMHRNDCDLDDSQNIDQYFSVGDRVRGICEPSDMAKGKFRFRLIQVLERRLLPTWENIPVAQ